MFEFLRRFKRENPLKKKSEEELAEVEPMPAEEPAPVIIEPEHPKMPEIKEPRITNVPYESGQIPYILQMEIIKRVAWYWKDAQIVKWFKNDMDYSISPATVRKYRNDEKFQPLIEREREQYNTLIFRVPLANKRNRLDQLQRQYDEISEFSGKEIRKESRDILRDVRDEIETKIGGDINFNFTQVNNNQFSKMSYEDLMKIKADTLQKLENIKRMKQLNQGDRNDLVKEAEISIEEA